jgi:hypothetical protein
MEEKMVDVVVAVGGRVYPGAGKCLAGVGTGGKKVVAVEKTAKQNPRRVVAGITVRSAHGIVRKGTGADGGIEVPGKQQEMAGGSASKCVIQLVVSVQAHAGWVGRGGGVVDDMVMERPSTCK